MRLLKSYTYFRQSLVINSERVTTKICWTPPHCIEVHYVIHIVTLRLHHEHYYVADWRE